MRKILVVKKKSAISFSFPFFYFSGSLVRKEAAGRGIVSCAHLRLTMRAFLYKTFLSAMSSGYAFSA
jgi:hypothetical protein